MQETFERVTERHGKVEVPVKHFYRTAYQTRGGNWSTVFVNCLLCPLQGLEGPAAHVSAWI